MDQLPSEMILKILSYISTYDLIQFCNAFVNYKYVFNEKSIVRLIDFSRRFELQNIPLCKFIATNLNYGFIKILNINYLYWIPGQELRRLLKKLDNLEVLLAIDTKLGIKELDIVEYVNLKKLAVSVESADFNDATVVASKALKALKSLLLKFTRRNQDLRGASLFFNEIIQLEELWICDDDESTYRINYSQIAASLFNLRKFVIKSKSVLPYFDFEYPAGLIRIFECKRSDTATELVFENLFRHESTKISIFEPLESYTAESWEIFKRLHKDVLCGPRESKALYLKKPVEDLYFEDLNFSHTIVFCNLKYINAALQILVSINASKLKRLNFRSCLFQNTQEQTNNDQESSFKKPRKGVVINSLSHPFQNVADNLKKSLRELEILYCPRCGDGVVLSAYPTIATFENLLQLAIEVPFLLDGSFLEQVFRSCRHLKSVNFMCIGQNEKFMIDLCQNLKHAANLRDFRLDHKEIVIDKLLNSFNEINDKKLQRIFLKCDKFRYTSNQNESLLRFMNNNPQLIFFCCTISKHTTKQNSEIQQILNGFRRGNPVKIFYVKKDMASFKGTFPIPAAHHDIIFYYTNVSVIHLDDF